jgi:hypothetical protein
MLGLSQQKNSKKQGDVGLAIAIGTLAQMGYSICIPLTDSQDYDLVIDVGGVLSKVQVRTTFYRKPGGLFEVNLLVSGGNRSGTGKVKHFDALRIDYLFVVTDDNEKYFIPASVIEATRSITLGKKYDQYLVT